jgi:hypothetical protein
MSEKKINNRMEEENIALSRENKVFRSDISMNKSPVPNIPSKKSFVTLTGSPTGPAITNKVINGVPRYRNLEMTFSRLELRMPKSYLVDKPKPGPLERGNRVLVLDLFQIKGGRLCLYLLLDLDY